MWPFRSVCEYCENKGAEESCDNCGREFHLECAEKAGDLTAKQQVSDLLAAKPTQYHWDCPDCERRAHGKS